MDADIEATVDHVVRQARDVAAAARELLDCVTCWDPVAGRSTGRVRVSDPTASAYFPKRRIEVICKDCGGTGRDPAQEPT